MSRSHRLPASAELDRKSTIPRLPRHPGSRDARPDVPLVSLCPRDAWQTVPGRAVRVEAASEKWETVGTARRRSACWRCGDARGARGKAGQLDCDRSVERDDLPMLGKGEREDAARVRGTRARAQRSTPSRRSRDAAQRRFRLSLSLLLRQHKAHSLLCQATRDSVHSHAAHRIITLNPPARALQPNLGDNARRASAFWVPGPPSPLCSTCSYLQKAHHRRLQCFYRLPRARAGMAASAA